MDYKNKYLKYKKKYLLLKYKQQEGGMFNRLFSAIPDSIQAITGSNLSEEQIKILDNFYKIFMLDTNLDSIKNSKKLIMDIVDDSATVTDNEKIKNLLQYIPDTISKNPDVERSKAINLYFNTVRIYPSPTTHIFDSWFIYHHNYKDQYRYKITIKYPELFTSLNIQKYIIYKRKQVRDAAAADAAAKAAEVKREQIEKEAKEAKEAKEQLFEIKQMFTTLYKKENLSESEFNEIQLLLKVLLDHTNDTFKREWMLNLDKSWNVDYREEEYNMHDTPSRFYTYTKVKHRGPPL